MEIMYSLQTFGISPDHIPVLGNTGKVKTQNHLKWMSMRRAMEKAKASGGPNFVFRGIECPSHQDVLLGRGKPCSIHAGLCFAKCSPSCTFHMGFRQVVVTDHFDCLAVFLLSSRKCGHAAGR
jgi:hypothetical protein